MALVAAMMKLGQPSRTCNNHDIELIERVIDTIKCYLRAKGVAWIHEKADAPILVLHGVDGAPLTARERYRRGQGATRVERHGRQCKEYLSQRILQDSSGSTRVVLTEP